MAYVVLTLTLPVVAILVATFIYFWWPRRSRRPNEPGFRYVYVNNRGRARELCAEEREYLSQKFGPKSLRNSANPKQPSACDVGDSRCEWLGGRAALAHGDRR